MTLLDDRLETRGADKAQALGAIASALALIDSEHREPTLWERLCLLRAFSLVAAGCYLLAESEIRDLPETPPLTMLALRNDSPVLARLELPTLFEALKEAMEEDARLYPHLGPTALG